MRSLPRFYSSLRTERHTEQSQELSAFFVTLSRRNDDYVHAADFINLIIVDFRENQLFLEADGVVATTVKGLGIDTTEVTDTRKSDVHEFIKEFIHAAAAERNLDTNGHAFTQFESSDGFLGFRDEGFLAGNNSQVLNCGINGFAVGDSIAAANVDDNLFQFRKFVDILIIELFH